MLVHKGSLCGVFMPLNALMLFAQKKNVSTLLMPDFQGQCVTLESIWYISACYTP